jgi:hypothetical protein
MNCQDYQEWIEDAALGAIAGSTAGSIHGSRRTQLDAHLAACPECRRAFEAAQNLYAAIDRGVAAGVEGTPSGAFAAGVLARLGARASWLPFDPAALRAGRPWSQGWWRRRIWIPALGSAALALLLLSIWIARRPNQHRQQPPKQQIAQAVTASPEGLGVRVRGPGAGGEGSVVARGQGPRPRSNRSRRRQSTPDSGALQLQVQIQPGQWAAVTSLYRAGQSGKVNETGKDVPADQPLQMTPLEVSPLVVAELQDPKPVGSEPESTNDQDR